MNDTTRRARFKAKSPEESERWRRLAEKRRKRHDGAPTKDDPSSVTLAVTAARFLIARIRM